VEDAEPLNTIEPWQAVFYIEYEEEGKWGARMTGTHRAAKKSADLDSKSGDLPIDGSVVMDLVSWVSINETFQLRAGLNNLTDEKYFLWSSARRGGGHVATSTEERNMQPGTHGFLSLRASF
jgi:hemoglobin/transferrin/lactoferrin receptor protein